MKKQNYLKPASKVKNLEIESLLGADSIKTGETVTVGGETEEGEPAAPAKSGSLWNADE